MIITTKVIKLLIFFQEKYLKSGKTPSNSKITKIIKIYFLKSLC